jgi:hypothetical protein
MSKKLDLRQQRKNAGEFEQVPEENIWAQDGGSDMTLEKIT